MPEMSQTTDKTTGLEGDLEAPLRRSDETSQQETMTDEVCQPANSMRVERQADLKAPMPSMSQPTANISGWREEITCRRLRLDKTSLSRPARHKEPPKEPETVTIEDTGDDEEGGQVRDMDDGEEVALQPAASREGGSGSDRAGEDELEAEMGEEIDRQNLETCTPNRKKIKREL